MPQIKIKCKGSGLRKLKSLKILQGDLKELSKENYKKLRNRIEKYGFDAPFFVWKDYILDGTQRKRVLDEMLKDGWSLENDNVPVVNIQADSLNDAKQRILGYISQYGTITDEGLYQFINDIPDIDLESLDLPDFNISNFKDSYLTNDVIIDSKEPKKHKCPECGYEF